MSSNKQARKELERIYGKGCMFSKAKIAEKIEARGGIKTYKQYKETVRYKRSKKIQMEKTMNYHHLKHKKDGGKATIENGAVVNSLAHQYLHSLPREQEEVINNMLRDYKKSFVLGTAQISSRGIEKVQEIRLPEITEDCLEIEAETMTAEEKAMYEEYKRKRAKKQFSKFGVRLETPEEKWKREQQEIIEDVLEELRY